MKRLTQAQAKKIIADTHKLSTSAYCVQYDEEKGCFFETNMSGEWLYEFYPQEMKHTNIVLELTRHIVSFKKATNDTFKLTKTTAYNDKPSLYSITPKGAVSKRISQALYELLFEKCEKVYQRTLHPRLTSEHKVS